VTSDCLEVLENVGARSGGERALAGEQFLVGNGQAVMVVKR